MAKSFTRKKYDKKKPLPPAIKEISNVATEYIKQWTRGELARFQHEGKPICVPTKNGYKIGLYALEIQQDRTCTVWNHHRELVHTFDNKINAILWTVYTIKHRYWVSDQIMALDKEINKNYVDTQTLRRGIQLARDINDYYKVDIKQARLEIAEKKLEVARDRLSKIHKSAKYNKVWDN